MKFAFFLAISWISLQAQEGVAIPDGTNTARTPAASDHSMADASPNKSPLPDPITPAATAVLPAVRETRLPSNDTGVEWRGLSLGISRFLAIEHSFRLMTEPGTRAGLKGSFFGNYSRAVANLHGWADGDEFYVNYVGHPMQGSVAGFLWAQNDRHYGRAEFSGGPMYWKSRLRAAAFAWAYSTQFEIGLLSEASIGGIQTSFPQQGFVDHVITPSVGMAWMIGEDAIDRYVIKRIEASTTNRWLRLMARSSLNPTRTFANVLNARAPWSRDNRLGILSYRAPDAGSLVTEIHSRQKSGQTNPVYGAAAPFELAVTFQPERFWGGNSRALCLGGGANAGFRLAPSWQLVADIAGCKMIGLEKNLSGDSLTYLAGLRWMSHIRGSWTAQLQFLAGGNKITEERMYPELKKALELAAGRSNSEPPFHDSYTNTTESNGFAVASGAGLSYSLSKALSIKVADISYRHNWTSALWGRDFSNSLKVSSGLVLKMGTW